MSIVNKYIGYSLSSGGRVEPAAQSSATLQREEWMTMPLGPSDRALSIMTEKKREEDMEQRQIEKDVSVHLLYTCLNFGDCSPLMIWVGL